MGEPERLSEKRLEWWLRRYEEYDRDCPLRAHITALEAEIARVTLQVSNLTEANDDLHRQIAVIAKERDEARRDLGRSVLDATEAHRAKHAALDEIARLKPSGQDAEDDAETIREFIVAQEEPSDFALDALRRLAAKAQAHDAAVADNIGQVAEDVETLEQAVAAYPERFREDVRAATSRLAAKARGYEAAVAGNAELLEALADADHTDDCAFVRLFRTGPQALAPEAACDCYKAVEYKAHPGAALLEEHRKAPGESERKTLCLVLDELGADGAAEFLGEATNEQVHKLIWTHVRWLEARARNEGLEKAAERLRSLAEEARHEVGSARFDDNEAAAAKWAARANALEQGAVEILAMKESEQ